MRLSKDILQIIVDGIGSTMYHSHVISPLERSVTAQKRFKTAMSPLWRVLR